MAPTPSAKSHSILTPSSKSHQTHPKTPQSKHRLNFNLSKPSPNPNSALKETLQTEHPVEVIARIRDYPDRKEKPISALQLNSNRQSLRVKTEIGYRDFSLDGVSLSEEDDLDGFYKKFVESRINGVKLGDKCTVMMYGPTGSGKSHTMFGCAKEQGIVYKALRDILGSVEESEVKIGTFVQVTVLEIYNEEIYDLLSSNNGGGFSLGWSKGSASKVKLEVMGKKAKNASFISGTEAVKISKEIQKVEKRRIVKSTLCNERSSRSHCMIILDVPTVGGRLMLVDMAGSENIEQAGQSGLEAKMQDSFEDDKSKILMILCASPDPKEMHKTISTLEYGAKAKCIVRGPHTPLKENGAEDSSSATILGSRIAAMDQFIYKLQMENKVREKERNEAHKELMKKEEEVSSLRAKLALIETKGPTSEEEINMKVNERTQILKSELEKKIEECKKMADKYVEMERRKMEERIFQQQQELEMLRQRLEAIESELRCPREEENVSVGVEGTSFAKRLLEVYDDEDPGMLKSMDLDKSLDLDTGKRDAPLHIQAILGYPNVSNLNNEEDDEVFLPSFAKKACLSTVFEEEEEEGEDKETHVDEEVQKEVIEEKKVCSSNSSNQNAERLEREKETNMGSSLIDEPQNSKDDAASRQMRIQNIFTLCGNYRELSRTPYPTKKKAESFDSPSSPVRSIVEDRSPKVSFNQFPQFQKSVSGDLHEKMDKIRGFDEKSLDSKENYNPMINESGNGDMEVYVKWEASKENPGKLITTLKVVKEATLADLRKLIEIHLDADSQAFTFLVLGDPTGAPVPREKEADIPASKLPVCNTQLNGHLACLRPIKGAQWLTHLPFSPLENKFPVTPISQLQGESFSPKIVQNLNSTTPFITHRRSVTKPKRV
ncbi:hypothetical protein LguiA_030634 [Lonicera macranthoides]